MPPVPPPVSALVAYETFADVYDLFTADHDYDAWIRTIEPLAHRTGLRGRTVLDVGCGTGKSLLPWLERHYAVAGCDLSPRMLTHARRKVGDRATLYRADMRRLPPGPAVHLVTCLDDAVNYLLRPRDVALAFRCAAARLSAGGVYVFDVNSLRAYREDFAAVHSFSRGQWTFSWIGEGSGSTEAHGTAAATILAHSPAAHRGAVIRSRHVQRHHPIPFVRELLARAGMRDVAVHGQHRDGSLDDDFDELVHAKALVLARKA